MGKKATNEVMVNADYEVKEVERTITLKNCFVKAFLFSDGTSSRKYCDAVKHLKNNEEVRIVVHTKHMGCWVSSPIKKYYFGLGQKYVTTAAHKYQIAGKEPIKRLRFANFYVEGVKSVYTVEKHQDLAKVLGYLELGAKVHAQVTEKNGMSHLTGSVIEFNPSKRYFVTQSRSVYRW